MSLLAVIPGISTAGSSFSNQVLFLVGAGTAGERLILVRLYECTLCGQAVLRVHLLGRALRRGSGLDMHLLV